MVQCQIILLSLLSTHPQKDNVMNMLLLRLIRWHRWKCVKPILSNRKVMQRNSELKKISIRVSKYFTPVNMNSLTAQKYRSSFCTILSSVLFPFRLYSPISLRYKFSEKCSQWITRRITFCCAFDRKWFGNALQFGEELSILTLPQKSWQA